MPFVPARTRLVPDTLADEKFGGVDGNETNNKSTELLATLF